MWPSRSGDPRGSDPEILNCFEPKWLSRGADVDSLYELVRSFLLGKLPVPVRRSSGPMSRSCIPLNCF